MSERRLMNHEVVRNMRPLVGGNFSGASIGENIIDTHIQSIITLKKPIQRDKFYFITAAFHQGPNGNYQVVAASVLIKGDFLYRDTSIASSEYGHPFILIPADSGHSNYESIKIKNNNNGNDFSPTYTLYCSIYNSIYSDVAIFEVA